MTELLTAQDATDLARYERTIEKGLKVFVEVGTALLAIQDRRLYRLTHSTFEDYCQDRWGISRDYAYKTIRAANTVAALEAVQAPVPQTESQARELIGLSPEKAAEVMRQASTGGKVTAAGIKQARAKVEHPPTPTPPTTRAAVTPAPAPEPAAVAPATESKPRTGNRDWDARHKWGFPEAPNAWTVLGERPTASTVLALVRKMATGQPGAARRWLLYNHNGNETLVVNHEAMRELVDLWHCTGGRLTDEARELAGVIAHNYGCNIDHDNQVITFREWEDSRVSTSHLRLKVKIQVLTRTDPEFRDFIKKESTLTP